MHVICYTDARGVGGAEISLQRLVAHLPPDLRLSLAGVADTVLARIGSGRERSERILLDDRGPHGLWRHLRCFRSLRPDVIHINCHSPWTCQTALLAALLTPRVRIVRVDQLVLRTTRVDKMWRIRALCLRVDAHVAVGAASARQMENYYLLGRHTVRTIHNSAPPGPEPSPPPAGDRLVVVAVGRFDAQKGHDVLLHALASLPDVEAVLVGSGADRGDLEALAQRLGVADRVRFAGWVEDPRPFLDACHVFVQPSRSEGFPLSVVEAMFAGRPVIATDVGSVNEAIQDGQTGLLIPKDDPTALVHAIVRLRDRPEERRRLGVQARRRAECLFTAQRMADQYVALWREVCQRSRSARLWVGSPNP